MSVTEQIKSQVLCDGAGHAGRVDFFCIVFILTQQHAVVLVILLLA